MPARKFSVSKNHALRIEAELQGKVAQVRLSGFLSEDLSLNELRQFIDESRSSIDLISLDLKGVSQFNSCGIREWLLFIGWLKGGATPYEFEILSEAFLEAAGALPAMLGKPGTRIGAIEVPYYCSRCDQRVAHVLGPGDIVPEGTGYVAPQKNCAQCGSKLEFDSLEQEYFRFLK